MAGVQRWQELLVAATGDNLSGARGVTASAASVLVAYSRQGQPQTQGELVGALRLISRELIGAQPAMASVVNLLNRAWLAGERGGEVEERLGHLCEAVQGFVEEVEGVGERVARRALDFLPDGTGVLTISASSTVLSALLCAQREGRRLRVICLESRPVLEGREFAFRLAEAGVPVTLVVDASMADAVREADVVFVGADSLTPDGVIGKIGTAALALVALALGVPVFVLADRSKVWPVGLGRPAIRERPVEEVWAEAPSGVRVRNRYFDLADWAGFRGVVVEDGLLNYEEVRRAGRSMGVSEELVRLYRDAVRGER